MTKLIIFDQFCDHLHDCARKYLLLTSEELRDIEFPYAERWQQYIRDEVTIEALGYLFCMIALQYKIRKNQG